MEKEGKKEIGEKVENEEKEMLANEENVETKD